MRSSYSNNNSDENTETDENDDSSTEADFDIRFGFVWVVPDDTPAQKKHMIEWKKRGNGFTAAKTEFESVSTNWIECKVK